VHKVNPDKLRKKKWTIISTATITEEVEFERELTREEAINWYSYGQILGGQSVKVDTDILQTEVAF
jgi:hypothetical protein